MKRGHKPIMIAALLTCGIDARAQCLQNHLVIDGLPSSQRDCQPLAALERLTPDQMSAAARQWVTSRHADLQHAASFYGYDIDAPGWTFQQAVSPLLRHHIILTYTNAAKPRQASHFIAVLPEDSNHLVQVLPTFTRGLRLFDPGWQKKGTFGVFNRLMKNEGNNHPITVNTEWISYAAIYLTLAGDDPSIPTDSDSIQANWNLAARHGTTPVVTIMKDGSATIACTDVAEGGRTLSWKLYFNKFGQIANAERLELRPLKVLTMQTANETQTLQVPAPSALNP
jgi:hypothetical protein